MASLSLFEKITEGTEGNPEALKQVKYIFAGSTRVCSVELSPNPSLLTTHYYHSDHLGSSNVVTDSSGQVESLTEFTPFGSISKQQGAFDPRHKFTGKELDSTGLYFYGARYYDPEIGRFITADTIVQAPYDPQSLNRYSYCRNNPINYVDPTGHWWWFLGLLFSGLKGAFFGSLIGGAVSAATGGNIGQGFMTGAISGFCFGIVGGLSLQPGIASVIGHTIAGSVSGVANAAVTGGDLGMGAAIGGVSAGASECLGVYGPTFLKTVAPTGIGGFARNLLTRALSGALVGGAVSAAFGGDFGKGAQQGAVTAAIAYTANHALHQDEAKEQAKEALTTSKDKSELAPSDVNQNKCEKACGEGWNQKLVPEAPGGVSFTKACSGHDCCCACTGDKAKCAENFLTDMLKACVEGPYSLRDDCAESAKLYYNIVRSSVGTCKKNYDDCRNCKK